MLPIDCCDVIAGTRSSLYSDPGSFFPTVAAKSIAPGHAIQIVHTTTIRTERVERFNMGVARINAARWSNVYKQLMMLCASANRNRLARFDRFLGGKAHRNRPAAVDGAAGKIAALA